MKLDAANAAAAYAGAARKATGPGLEPRAGAQSEFAGALQEAAKSALGTLKGAEAVSLQAAAGKASGSTNQI